MAQAQQTQQAQQGDTVKVEYTGKFDDGTVFDSSDGREPLQFTIGEGEVIPGFEEGVIGMAPGQKKTINIPAEKAYGPHYDEAVLNVPRDQFPADMELQEGDRLQLKQPDGSTIVVTISDVNESSVSLDGNHPLAGEDLTFDVDLVEIVKQ